MLGRLNLRRHIRGAVAPTVALSLFALIGMGGLAFDYAHLANLDTELQNAADQAALAAATQLDGSNGSRVRAEAAAKQLLNNTSLFASDGARDAAGRRVAIATVEFFESYNEATDAYGPVANNDADARVVQVSVGGRRADYALTPVVGAITSGTINAQALASLASSVCKVPPLMMCALPGTDFPTAADIGRGVLLQPGPNVGAWAPGDYGYLDFADGASGLSINLGRNSEFAGCVDMDEGIPTEPGNKASVTDALNSRFDLYPGPAAACDPSTGDFCPAENTSKDLALTYELEVTDEDGLEATIPDNPGCDSKGKMIDTKNAIDNGGFNLPSPPQGLPRDACHIADNCTPNAKYGDGSWNRDGYLGATHGMTAAAVAAALGKTEGTLTRYDIYKWEIADKANRLTTKMSNPTAPVFTAAKGKNPATYTFTNRCSYPQPRVNGNAVVPSATQKDRRILTVAAVDCTGLNGKSDVIVQQWVDVLLVEPSLDRSAPPSTYASGKEQIYVEIIGVAKLPNGNSAFQNFLRQRARLLR